MTFSEKILHLRKARGLDQIKVAKQLGVTRQSMYKWESGVCMPELNKIKRLAEIYGVSCGYLLNDDVENEETQSDFIQSQNNSIENGDDNNPKEKHKKIIILASFLAVFVILCSILTVILFNLIDKEDEVNNKNSEITLIEHTPQHEMTLAYVCDKQGCEESGRVLMQCKEPNCDYVELVVQAPLNHDFDENTQCTRCDYIVGTNGIEYATDNGEEYYVKSIGSCTEKRIIIANKCNGKKVVAISADAFKETDITSLKIPSTVEKIGNSAFYGCSNLENVTFSENLKIIGEEAFYNCKLKTLILPDSIEEIHRYSFYQNEIEELYVGKNAKYIGSYAFYLCPISIYTYNGDKLWHGYTSNKQHEGQFILTEYTLKKWFWYDLYVEEEE